jgi:hypothetical protein
VLIKPEYRAARNVGEIIMPADDSQNFPDITQYERQITSEFHMGRVCQKPPYLG